MSPSLGKTQSQLKNF
jgi:hypothetical protein